MKRAGYFTHSILITQTSQQNHRKSACFTQHGWITVNPKFPHESSNATRVKKKVGRLLFFLSSRGRSQNPRAFIRDSNVEELKGPREAIYRDENGGLVKSQGSCQQKVKPAKSNREVGRPGGLTAKATIFLLLENGNKGRNKKSTKSPKVIRNQQKSKRQ